MSSTNFTWSIIEYFCSNKSHNFTIQIFTIYNYWSTDDNVWKLIPLIGFFPLLYSLCEKFFMVRIILYSDWIQENKDHKKLRISTLFKQCFIWEFLLIFWKHFWSNSFARSMYRFVHNSKTEKVYEKTCFSCFVFRALALFLNFH